MKGGVSSDWIRISNPCCDHYHCGTDLKRTNHGAEEVTSNEDT